MSEALIALCLRTGGFAWLCETLSRFDDPDYVAKPLEELLHFVSPADFDGRRILDFGCGRGASTLVLARMFPTAQVVGVELEEQRLEVATAVGLEREYGNVLFRRSPDGESLPAGIGTFALIVMSAVYEHMLPAERKTIMPLLWSTLAPGGVLFINQTPHKYFPIELHSTGMPLINYLPDRMTHWVVRHFCRRRSAINRSENWEDHLRGGIRGADEREILANLAGDEKHPPAILPPRELEDRVDTWYAALNPDTYKRTKRLLKIITKKIYRVTGTVFLPNLTLVVKKTEAPPRSNQM